MAKIRFYLEKRKDKTGTVISKNVPIRFSISYGSRYMSSTGFRVDAKFWDSKNQRVTGSHNQALYINKALTDLKTELSDMFYRAKADKIPMTSEYFSKNLSKNQKSQKGFFDYFNQYIEQGRDKWQPGTVKKFITMKNHLEELRDTHKIRIEFDELNDRFLSKLLDFYFDDKDFINTHVRKNLKFIKQFLEWATKHGYNKNLSYKEWKLETGSKVERASEKIFLTLEEIRKIIDTEVTGTSLEKIKDYIILASFCGLRYSDIANLKKTDIDYTKGLIQCTTIKTGEKAIIPFNDFSREILEKYQYSKNLNSKGIDMAFPTISNQKTNKALKELAKLAGINGMTPVIYNKRNVRFEDVKPKYELISSHTGRKTFITLSVALGIQSEVVMGITTHKSHEAFEHYYTVNLPMKRDAMAKFNKENLLKIV